MNYISLRVSDHLKDKLDQETKLLKLSNRSDLLRRMINDHFNNKDILRSIDNINIKLDDVTSICNTQAALNDEHHSAFIQFVKSLNEDE